MLPTNPICRSQHTWGEANAKGVFADEIAPIEIKTMKGVKEFTADEHPRPQTQIEGLAKLPAGTVRDLTSLDRLNSVLILFVDEFPKEKQR